MLHKLVKIISQLLLVFIIEYGGDGTIEIVNYYLKGKTVSVVVNDPFFKPVRASYLFAETSKTAFIEMAEASGVKLLKSQEFDCKNATTFGTGELILDAIYKVATTIILGIGGSATNDCGIGMATALGYRFLNKDSKELKPIGSNLSSIVTINTENVYPSLRDITFKIACDVTNPLYGNNGAAYIYGAQKGASKKDIKLLDKGLQDFSKIIQKTYNIDVQSVKGAGAAGGMGIASKVFLNGNLESGIELVKNLADFNDNIRNSDWIITGEGKLDKQTLSGKTIQGVISSAKKENIKVASFCGIIDLDTEILKNFGVHYSDAILNYSKDINEAMEKGLYYLNEMAQKFAKRL